MTNLFDGFDQLFELAKTLDEKIKISLEYEILMLNRTQSKS